MSDCNPPLILPAQYTSLPFPPWTFAQHKIRRRSNSYPTTSVSLNFSLIPNIPRGLPLRPVPLGSLKTTPRVLSRSTRYSRVPGRRASIEHLSSFVCALLVSQMHSVSNGILVSPIQHYNAPLTPPVAVENDVVCVFSPNHVGD